MEKVILHATRRPELGKKVGALRRLGKLPAVMYGRHIVATPITLDLRDASRLLGRLTASSLVTIELDGQENAALVREKQRDYIRGTLQHVDFQVVSLTEKIRANVVVELVGVSPAVKDFNGVVVTGLDELEVECFPQYLPERFVLDISSLKKIGDGFYVRDIPVPENVQILVAGDEKLVAVSATEEEKTGEAGLAGPEEPEVIEKGKKEEEGKEDKK